MKIEQCIEDFIQSIVQKDPELFCSLLCPKDLSLLRKKLYISKRHLGVNNYVKEKYLKKLTYLVTTFYKYEYFKVGDKYIVKYYFSKNNAYLKTAFKIAGDSTKPLFNLDINKMQVKCFHHPYDVRDARVN
ncbi:MAG TPA: hypothetical protein VK115_08910 [Staphylococcus sp.]|nr:hypothetical protein [Staphylococcus sp.]